jgi:hypothetical protein
MATKVMDSCDIAKYTIEDFQKFIDGGFGHNKLDDAVMKIIQSISSSVGSPEYIKTPQFNNTKVDAAHKRPNKHQEVSNIEWERLRRFKATVFEKKQGIESSIDQIRKSLNKMTDKTYDTLIIQIMAEIDKIITLSSKHIEEGEGADGVEETKETKETKDKKEETPEIEMTDELLADLKRVGNSIFDIASGNGFYSKMYANLYNDLMRKYDFMRVIFDKNVDEMNEIFKNIEYCDPSVDYDKFCDNNKKNEKRRSMSLFYVHLMNLGIITTHKILGIIRELQDTIISLLDEQGKQSIVEELSEIVFIMVKNSINNKKVSVYESTPTLWNPIIDNIRLLATMKAKSKPSISSKTIFKHLDILDLFE